MPEYKKFVKDMELEDVLEANTDRVVLVHDNINGNTVITRAYIGMNVENRYEIIEALYRNNPSIEIR